MYKAYIVLGGESTGTRLVTRILIRAGCIGDSGHVQSLDELIPNHKLDLRAGQSFVWRRSMPHNKHWIDIRQELYVPVLRLISNPKDICVVVTTRNWFCAARSGAKAGHSVGFSEALGCLERAYIDILNFVRGCPFTIKYYMVSYDALIGISKLLYLTHLNQELELGLCHDSVVDIASGLSDENEKHFWELSHE